MRVAALLAVLLVLPALAVAAPLPGADWRAKADAPLAAAVESGHGLLTMVVQGPALPAPDPVPADRAAWRAHWDAASGPFLAALRARVASLGGEVPLGVAPVGAAFVRLDASGVPALLAWGDVRRAGLDGADAVRPFGGEGPGIALSMGEALGHLDVAPLYDDGLRGEGIRVAIVDTGIRSSHDTMRRADGTTRVVGWYDATSEPCATPCDNNGHGTSAASIAAGSDLFNASAPSGAAPRADILGVRIFVGGGGTWEDAQEGLQAAFDLGADVAANAWGGSCAGAAITTGELAEALADAGMASVFPSGSSNPIGCPGAADRVLTVGMTDANEVVASNSARGPCTWQTVQRTCPDLMAVSVSLVLASNACDTCYSTTTGSSWSAAQLTGVVALLEHARRARGGELSPAEAEAVLHATGRDLGAEGPDNDYGWGMANAAAAYDALVEEGVVLRAFLLVGKPEVRGWDASTLAFHVINVGSVPVGGHLTHRVVQTSFGPCPPACDATTIADRDTVLAALGQTSSSLLFAGADHPPGAYRVTGTFDYTYVDPADGQAKSGRLERTGAFVVKKVLWANARGVPDVASPGALLPGGVVLANVGNEAASGVRFTERFAPKGHAPAPLLAAPDPAALPNGLFASPPPDKVEVMGADRAEYRWTSIGSIVPGASWSAEYNVVAGLPGEYLFEGSLTFADETGHAFAVDFDQGKVVALPAP